MINLYNGDCLEAMRGMEDNSFDLAIVDPPYGIGISNIKKYGSRNLGYSVQEYENKNWDKNIPSKEYFDQLFRVSENQIIFGANYFVAFIPPKKGWLVWDKRIGNNNFSMHELIYTSMSITPKIISVSIEKNRVSNNLEKAKKNARIHPTQKPVALYTWLLDRYAKEGDRILDTHLGSGSIAIACHNLGYDLVGYELDPDYYQAACNRLQEHQKQLRLF